MPDVYVFPGGRVDRTDATRPAASELRPAVAAQVGRSASSSSRARALAVAAVRETYEETGLLLGERDANGIRPALAKLDFVARAITPALNPIRYHARFFLADGEGLGGRLRSNGELLDLAWLPIPKALELNIIDVTEFVLQEVASRLAGTAAVGLPLVSYRGEARRIRRQ